MENEPNKWPVYVRPCPLMPDGIEMTRNVADILIGRGLIVPEDEWPGESR